MSKIAILGGSFDPVHFGHLNLAKVVKKKLNCKEVWFLPTLKTPLKDRELTNFTVRCRMINAAIKPYRHFKLCKIEEKLPTPSYTYNTICELKRLYPQHEFCWIIGDDQYEKLDRWHKIEECRKIVQFVCAYRNSSLPKEDQDIIFVEDFYSKESSTLVREGHFQDVPKAVRKIIVDHHLYFKEILKMRVKLKRFEHSLSVASVAKKLASVHGVDEDKAYLAGLLHDVSKSVDTNEMERLMNIYYPMHLSKPEPIWHQWIAVIELKQQLGLYDKHILNAIEHHATGDARSKLAKILFVADKIEPLRKYDTSKLTQLSLQDLNKAVRQIQIEQVRYLKGKEE